MYFNPYIIQSFLTCPREAWLEYHSISSDQEHGFLAIGRLVHETSYKRDKKEVFVDNFMKIDIVRDELVAEVKKSSRHKEAALLQLAYYLYYLKHEKDIKVEGLLLFPKERKKEVVKLTPELEARVEEILRDIEKLVKKDTPPPVRKTKYCKKCAFYEFCYAEEEG